MNFEQSTRLERAVADSQPHFRFHPRAYELEGVFERSSDACSVCGSPADWRYKGNIYTEHRDLKVCARCIANARVHEVAGSDFSFHDIELEGAEPEFAQELLQRTPGVACFNPYTWPVMGGEPLAFIGYGDDQTLWSDPFIQGELKRHWRVEMKEELEEPTPYVLAFRSLDGSHIRIAVDFD